MDVYFIPARRADASSPTSSTDDDAEQSRAEGGAARGFFARMRARFAEMIKEAEEARHEKTHEAPTTFLGRLQRKLMGWVAERVAEQRLLWQLAQADEASCTCPTICDPNEALRLVHAHGLQKDADRHLRLLALHALALIASAAVRRRAWAQCPRLPLHLHGRRPLPGVARCAARPARRCEWSVHAERRRSPTIGRAVVAPSRPSAIALIHEAAERLRLRAPGPLRRADGRSSRVIFSTS